MARIVLAMSGGVDSSVAAHLLLEQGHEPIGVFMRHGEESVESCDVDDGSPLLPLLQGRADHKQGCCSASDAADARRVAGELGIPFYALNLQSDFRQIVDYFVDEYSRGRTPNPCVMCNNWIKFGRLFDYADSVGAEFVATGHYAQLLENETSEPELRRGVDQTKDQSYVLFGIQRHLLKRIMLPVGGYQKQEIRALASQLDMRIADKRDSQEICFVSSGHHAEFVGLGGALGEPRFVVRIASESKRVVIGSHDELARHQLQADRLNWLTDPPAGKFACLAQIRYNSRPQSAEAEVLDNGQLQVILESAGFGVAPGQAVVLYQDQRVLGGGWIL